MAQWKPEEADLTQETVRKYFNYDPETGHLTRIATTGRRSDGIGRRSGSLDRFDGYRVVGLGSSRFREHRIIWLWMHGTLPLSIDHINRDRSDNRANNLRVATLAENNRNRTISKKNTSGVTGVTWLGNAKKWKARIRCNGKLKCLGTYPDFESAVSKRRAAEKTIYGLFAPER